MVCIEESFSTNTSIEKLTTEMVVRLSSPNIFYPAIPSRGKALQVELWHSTWSIGLGWVLRMQGIIPESSQAFATANVKAWKPFGGILNAKLELCKAIQNLLDDYDASSSLEFTHAHAHWEALVKEVMQDNLAELGLRQGKRKMETDLDEFISSLKKSFITGANPYDPQRHPHHYNLIETVIAVGKHQLNDNIAMRKARKKCRDAFKDFVDALQAWKRCLRNDARFKACYADGDWLAVIEGRREVTHY